MNESALLEDDTIYQDAEYAKALEEQRKDNLLLYYKPCCKVHFDKKLKEMTCPVLPCPDSKHWKFHTSDKRMKIILGGNRSSKSYSSLVELLLMACFKEHPFRKTKNAFPGHWRVYSADFAILEKLMIPLMKKLIPISCLQENGSNKEDAWNKSYDPRYHILSLKGGSMIDFMSYDQDSGKSASVDLDGVFADEEMPERIYTEAISRLISRNGKFMMAVTPLYSISWAMEFLETRDPQVETFNFHMMDNPFNSDEVIKDYENLIKAHPHEREARLFGHFMELKGLVYKELRNDVHLIGTENPPVDAPVIFALDPHPRKACVGVWAYVTGKDDVVFFDEMEVQGTAKDIIRAIKQKEANHNGRTLLRLIDPASKAQGSNLSFETDTLREFEKEGMSFSLADNSEAGYNIVHEYLAYDHDKPLSMFNRPRCFFTKDVPKTWYGMTHLMWDEWSFKKVLRDDKERVKDYKKDFPDGVRYVLAARPTLRSFYNTNPKPIGNWKRPGTHAFNKSRQDFRQMVFGKK